MKQITVNATDSKGMQKLIDTAGNGPTEFHFNAGNYDIVSQVKWYSNTKMTCDIGTFFNFMKDAPLSLFGNGVPIFTQKQSEITNIDLSGMNYNGNYRYEKNTPEDHGKGFGNCFGFKNITNSCFHDMNLGYNEGDEFRIDDFKYAGNAVCGSNLEFYNITSEDGGHDVFHFNRCKGVKVHDNNVKMRSNNVIRFRGCTDAYFYNNDCDGSTNESWAPAIQVENIDAGAITENVNVFNNYIHDTYGPGYWGFGGGTSNRAANIRAYNNLVARCGRMPANNAIPGVGGFVVDGLDIDIYNNDIIDCLGFGVAFGRYLGSCTRTGLKASVKNNIITGTKPALCLVAVFGAPSGCGIADLTGGRYTITVDGNCQYGNKQNHYKVNYTNSLSADPLFSNARSGDYHLQKNSPCVSSRGEIGMYAGTQEPTPAPCPGVIIYRDSEDDLRAYVRALRDSGYLEGGEEIGFINVSSGFEVN